MAKNKEPENKKLDKNDHKGTKIAARFIRLGGVGALGLAIKHKDKIIPVVTQTAKAIVKKERR